jgi:hypothetical protein
MRRINTLTLNTLLLGVTPDRGTHCTVSQDIGPTNGACTRTRTIVGPTARTPNCRAPNPEEVKSTKSPIVLQEIRSHVRRPLVGLGFSTHVITLRTTETCSNKRTYFEVLNKSGYTTCRRSRRQHLLGCPAALSRRRRRRGGVSWSRRGRAWRRRRGGIGVIRRRRGRGVGTLRRRRRGGVRTLRWGRRGRVGGVPSGR